MHWRNTCLKGLYTFHIKVFNSAVIKKPWQIKSVVKYLWLCWSGIMIFACIIVTKLIWKWLHCHHVCSLDKDVDRVLHACSEQQWWWRRWQTLLDRCPLVFPLDIFIANGPHTITSAACKSCTRQQATRCKDSSQNQNQSPSHPPAVHWQPVGPEKNPSLQSLFFIPSAFLLCDGLSKRCMLLHVGGYWPGWTGV